MTHLKMLKELLDGQAERGIKSGDWPRLEWEEERKPDHIILTINNLEIGFAFTFKGRLLGAFNWKQ